MRAFARIHDGLVHQRLGPQLCSTLGDPCLDETAGNGQCRVESVIVGFRIGLVENGLQGFQQRRQGEPRQLPGNGGAERSVVHQIDRQHEAGIERAMDRLDMRFRNTGSGEIVAAIVLPDQSERTVGLAVVAQRRTALMVIEDARIRIIGAADIVNDAVCTGCEPFRRPAADDARLREKPVEDDAGQQLIGMEATGMGDEEFWGHAWDAPCCLRRFACAPDSHCGMPSQPVFCVRCA